MKRTTKKERAIAAHLFEEARAVMGLGAADATWSGQNRATRRTWYALARVLVSKLARLGAS